MLTLCKPHSECGVIAVDIDNVSYYYLFVKKKNKLFLKPRSLLDFPQPFLWIPHRVIVFVYPLHLILCMQSVSFAKDNADYTVKSGGIDLDEIANVMFGCHRLSP